MAGDTSKSGQTRATPPTSDKNQPPSSSSNPKSHRQNPSTSSKPSTNTNKQHTPTKPPSNNPNPNSNAHIRPRFPFHDPSPPPTYGFHMLLRRTIILLDGTSRSYFALPPDYHDPSRLPPFGLMSPDGFRGSLEHPMKRKMVDEFERERDEFARHKQQLIHYANAGSGSPFKREDEFRASKAIRLGGGSSNSGLRQEVKVDPAIIKEFHRFVKLIFENGATKKNFLANGERGPLLCLACAGSSKDFPDVHSLVMHAYNSENADSRVNHLGFYRALCALMGWNCTKAPDNSGICHFLPANEAAALHDDLIMWPPMVIIHNTNTGKGKDGRTEGLGNKAMDSILRDLGFSGGKSKSLYNKDGHLGFTLIKFAADQLGLKEAVRLSDHFEKDRHGHRAWEHLQSMVASRDEENNPNLVMVDGRTGERRRIFYGYLLTASDLEKVDHETRKKAVIESKLEKLHASN